MKKLTYKSSGVDIQKADAFVGAIKGLVRSTRQPGVMDRTRAFGSLFALPKGYKEPVLVSSTDGVGTKLLIANHVGKHDTVGIDLVAMNVNDVLCVGAKPLFFLDYVGCGRVDKKVLVEVMKGVAEGCRQAGCALIGGETAEMPGMYKPEDYDLAGFTVGVVEKAKIIDGSNIRPGDVVIGLPSSGAHSNGYSLVRKVFSLAEQKTYARLILEPTRIYVKNILPLVGKFAIHGMAHNTGGAFYEKLTKCLPDACALEITKGAWPLPEIFQLIMKKANIAESELYRTFNMGVGFIVVVSPKDAPGVQKALIKTGMPSYVIGRVIKRDKEKIKLVGADLVSAR
ncbi:MAG: phosphoribosylformylglycinamidine cyclo-ligase [Candidatus Omnitrophica bacterium]|nr:phosphoribosylformylglycinamidine cyclo-ligase [Candidatus Omnitrophota bacterium]